MRQNGKDSENVVKLAETGLKAQKDRKNTVKRASIPSPGYIVSYL